MRIYELSPDGGSFARAMQRHRRAEARRTGLHVSTVVGDMLRQLDPRRYATELAEQTAHSFWAIGDAVETIIARELRRQYADFEKPEPGIYRGLSYSPDGWLPRSRTIVEMKACWTSERDFLQSLKFQGYLFQALFYAEADAARRIVLSVLFVNGNYTPPFPHPREFTIVPTKAEKETNADTIVQHAEDLGWLKDGTPTREYFDNGEEEAA